MIKVLLIIALLVIGVSSYFLYFNQSFLKTFNPPTRIDVHSPESSDSVNHNYCSLENLQTNITTNIGAGNVYGSLTLTNSSSQPCQISANPITAKIASSANNITASQTGNVMTKPLILVAGQTVYSQVHYPNGPQCSGPIVPTHVSFVYEVSPDNTVSFNSQDGNPLQVNACDPTGGNTDIQIWGISSDPITP